MNELDRISESSHYLATLLRRSDSLVDWLWNRKNLYRRYPLTELYEDLNRSVRGTESFDQLVRAFREFKQRHFLRIGGRDLLGLSDLVQSTSQLSDLADVALGTGLDVLQSRPELWLGKVDAGAWSNASEEVRLVVLGLGKLGGQELNYVSDVDLIFLHNYTSSRERYSEESPVLLSRLCQRLGRLLSDNVEGDRVFEVDLRLRPLGKDGPLVPSAAAAAEHYLHHGRPWERQMLLKTRPVAGTRSLGTAFIQEVRPFVFRRFLDFQALDELKAMRDRILREGQRFRAGWSQFDVKLGMGGIREIEFLVQSLQLIYGGRHPELDEPHTLRCIEKLRGLGFLPAKAAAELTDAYVLLRRVEHWVQLDQNRQTHKLPRSQESLRRLALALGFEGNAEAFQETLKSTCDQVHGHFLALFDSRGEKTQKSTETIPRDGDLPALKIRETLPAELLSGIENHLEAFPAALRQAVWLILEEYGQLHESDVPSRVAVRLDRYFGQVLKRPGLVKVFHSDAPWVAALCGGLARSELLADLLAHHPSLVEGIATASGEYVDANSWQIAGQRLLERSGDYEEGLEWIRRLKNERLLQLALGDLEGYLGYEVIERELSSLADFVIRHTYERVRASLELPENLPLCILALGKLGSREMSYLSDLDLVFVYEPLSSQPKDHIPVDAVRLVQRFMRMVSTPLHEGPGYPVDARLRPSGNYGPLIVTKQSWLEYYSHRADIWEVQTLLRVRNVGGHRDLGEWIQNQAHKICFKKRDPAEVWQRLCHLRQRMQLERTEETQDLIDIKLGLGGLADLEFLVQGNLLTGARDNPDLQRSSVRETLSLLSKSHIPGVHVPGDLPGIFGALRALEHRLRLHTNLPTSRISQTQFQSMREIGLWPTNNGLALEDWQDLLRLRRRVRSALQHWCPNL